MGRTGTLWAYEATGVVPDAITVAKALAGGLPAGALITGERLGGVLAPGDHGSTFAGGPVVAAAAHAALDVLDDPALLERVRELGTLLAESLRELPGVLDVRGRGLMVAADVDRSAPEVVRRALREQRLVINATGPQTLRFLPPLVLERAHVEDALGAARAAARRLARLGQRAAALPVGAGGACVYVNGGIEVEELAARKTSHRRRVVERRATFCVDSDVKRRTAAAGRDECDVLRTIARAARKPRRAHTPGTLSMRSLTNRGRHATAEHGVQPAAYAAAAAPPLVCGAHDRPAARSRHRSPPHRRPVGDARRLLSRAARGGRARAAALLRRPRHERDAQVDPGRVRGRGRRAHRQPRPARGGLRGRQGQGDAARRARLPRGRRARGVRARVRPAGDQGERRLRRRLPALHRARAPADRQAGGRVRAQDRLRHDRSRLHRQGQRPGADRGHGGDARAGAEGDRPGALVGDGARRGDRVRAQARDPGQGRDRERARTRSTTTSGAARPRASGSRTSRTRPTTTSSSS